MPNGNLLSTLQYIQRANRITRQEIAGQLGLGFSMVSRLTGELQERGLITEVGRSETRSGRPSDLLAVNPLAGYAIGLDINGTHQRAVLANLCGEVVESLEEHIYIPADRHAVLETLEQLTRRIIELSTLEHSAILGVGVSVWGSVDPAAGVVYSWTETPGLTTTWKDFAIRDALCERWSFPHIIIDDIVRTLGIAEVQYGQGLTQGEDFLFALADTGIGAAIMLNGTPYIGPNQLAGEIGHIPVNGGNLPCNCGNVGCLETVASATSILNRVRQRLERTGIRSVLCDMLSDLTIQNVIDAAENDDKLAYQVLTEAGEFFGNGLAMAVSILGPKRVIVGGVLAKSNVYMDAARRSMKLQVLSKAASTVRVQPSRLDELAGARGAAAQVLNALFAPGEANLISLSEMRRI